ncbi:MAG: hypothetical protein KF746_21625 [Chitinophagaceae bacterium]|nr:hypothetical protein [Chitinophagaceae bacterium]
MKKSCILLVVFFAITIANATPRPSVPSLAVLGSPGNYYTGIDWGSGVLWRHNNTGAGDIDIYDATGVSFKNIVYDSYSVSGSTTTFATKTLATGFRLLTTVENKGSGIYKITHTLASSTNRWLRLDRRLCDGSMGSSVVSTSNAVSYKNGINAISDLSPFQAAAAHHASGAAVGLIAGNGFDNDYCIINLVGYTKNTNWYNTKILVKDSNSVKLTYGLLKNGSTSDYTIRLQAGVARSLSYVINIFTPSSQSSLNAALYSAYYTAYTPSARTSNAIEQMLWSTAHQQQYIKRHILVEGSKVRVIAPCNKGYSGMISAGDIIFSAIGLNDSSVMSGILDMLHHLGPSTGTALLSNVLGGPDNNMNSSCALYIPFLELYAQTFLGYRPDSTAQATYLATAESYADAINNVKMIPDAPTRLAHFYSNIFGGSEVIGYGDFEEDFLFPMQSDTIYRWAEEASGGSTSRIGTDNEHVPHHGNYQCKMISSNGYAIRRLMPMAVPPSKTLTATAYVNIPNEFVSGGFRFNIIEQNSLRKTVATSTSSNVNKTNGWSQQSYTWKLNDSTCYVLIAIETKGNGTVYVDDVQCTMANPDYPGLIWSPCGMPPQIKGSELSTGAFSMAWAQLNLKCLKVLLGSKWKGVHEKALTAIDNTYPAAYWTDASQIKIREDIYHPIRKNWLTSFALFGHFMWYALSGEKIFNDTQITNIYNNYPKTAAGGTYGNIAFKGWLCNIDGSALGKEANWLTGFSIPAGRYVNGGGWLWASDVFFYKSAVWAGVEGAEAARRNRLNLDVSRFYAPHEAIDEHGNVTENEGYSANALMLINTVVEEK